MSKEAAKVKLPPGTNEWTFASAANKSDVNPLGRRNETVAEQTPTNARVEKKSLHTDKKTSKKFARDAAPWKTSTICGTLILLLAAGVALTQWSLTLAARPRVLDAIAWSTNTPDPLRPLAKRLARCGQDVTDPDAMAKVSTLSRDILLYGFVHTLR